MAAPPRATSAWNSTSSSVTRPWGITPSNVAALMNLFFSVSGPNVIGLKAGAPGVNFDTIGTIIGCRRARGEGMRVAVTDGTGYLGAHTVGALLGAGHSVRPLVTPDEGTAPVISVLREWGEVNARKDSGTSRTGGSCCEPAVQAISMRGCLRHVGPFRSEAADDATTR